METQKKRGITLTLTEACNLNCSYCYEHNKSPKKMTFETAKKIIDYELGGEEYEGITIDFFGGEPFIEFDLMRQICEYTWSRKWNKDYRFFVSTNGTLLNNDVKDWASSNAERFWLGLSYDGTPEMNNINRSNSSDQIDFFVNNWPLQGVKMTVSKETLPHLAEGVIFLHNRGFRVNCNLAYGPDWSSEEWDNVLQEQLMKLIDYYLENPNIPRCSMLNSELIFVSPNSHMKYTKWCGAGTNMRVYSPDGICYPCHFFEPLAVGEKMAKESLKIDFSQAAQLKDPDCEGCCLLPICPTCYGSNFASTGDVSKKDKNLCRLTKIMALANSYLQYRLLSEKSDEELGITQSQRKLLTDAIVVIQNTFAT